MLRSFLDRIKPSFEKGGRLEKLFPLFEMFDTFFYSVSDCTKKAPHIRDSMDLKRAMTYVMVAVAPCALFGCYNVGRIAFLQGNLSGIRWQAVSKIFTFFKLAPDASSILSCLIYGFSWFIPLYIITFIVGITVELIFAVVRKHEINEGFLVTSLLYVLTLPPALPLWIAGLGIFFGVFFGKEVFGGVGKNFINPALAGRAFLFFSYPAFMTGNHVWAVVDGYTGATPLALMASDGMAGIQNAGITFYDAFFGFIPGSFGETSTLLCLMGAAFLIFTKIGSYRIILGAFIGMIFVSGVFNIAGSSTNKMFEIMWLWHLAVGGFAFGIIFMATDPVSAAMTNTGRWIYGFFVGAMAVLIRVANPAFVEGVMLAILLGNIFAPFIDYFVIRANIKRRLKRNAL